MKISSTSFPPSFMLLCLMLLGLRPAMAQTVIGGNTPDQSAMLDVQSTTKGVLLPRMTTSERDGIANPPTGLMIFNTSTTCLEINLGSSATPVWAEIACPPPPVSPSDPPALGSTFTTYSNNLAGVPEMFSSNVTCQNKLISAGHSASSCSSSVVVGSNTYNTVLINGQCWMQTNLKEVPSNFSPVPVFVSLTDVGSWSFYSNAAMEPAAGEGLLYQWSAAMNGSTIERAQGVCPTGWHIPSDCELMYLEHGQGMAIAQQNNFNSWRSTTGEGDKISAAGSNSSGFSLLYSGVRNTPGNYAFRGNSSWIWTSTEDAASSGSKVMERLLSSDSPTNIRRESAPKAVSISVRCLKD